MHQALLAHVEVMNLHKQIKDPPPGCNRQQDEQLLNDLEKKVTTLKNKAASELDGNFVSKLEAAIERLQQDYKQGSVKLTMQEAHFQADSLLSSRAVSSISDIIVSTDTDFVALAGENGLCITSFAVKKGSKKCGAQRNLTLVDINLSCGLFSTIKQAADALHIDMVEDQKTKFYGISDSNSHQRQQRLRWKWRKDLC